MFTNTVPPMTLTGTMPNPWTGSWPQITGGTWTLPFDNNASSTNHPAVIGPFGHPTSEFDKELANFIEMLRRRPRLGHGAKPIRRVMPKCALSPALPPKPPLFARRLDRGASRMRGGRLRHHFKRLRHTTGRRKRSRARR